VTRTAELHVKLKADKTEGKGSLPRPMCRREDNIKKDVKEIWCKAVHFNELVRNGVHCQGLVNTVIKGGIS
jgi:hypothetical protein